MSGDDSVPPRNGEGERRPEGGGGGGPAPNAASSGGPPPPACGWSPSPFRGGTLRPATLADAPAITAIYAHHVLHGTASFEEVPPDASEIATRMARILDRDWPWLVAEEEGALLGYAYAGQLNPRSGYRYSCEDSIYLHPDHLGRGIGTALLRNLIQACIAAGFVRMFAVIGDSGNAGSIALHARHDFTHAGMLRSAGYKFGRWLDVVHMQRSLRELP